jgi:hypothetical protein
VTVSHTLDIDRIVLRGQNVTPDRVDRIRALLEMELQRQLEGGLFDDLDGGEMSRIEVPPMHLADLPQSDGRLVSEVAESIASALRNRGR